MSHSNVQSYFFFMPDLLARLERLRGSEKTVGEIGPTLMNWVSVSIETNEKLREKKGKSGTTHFHSFKVPVSESQSSVCAHLLPI